MRGEIVASVALSVPDKLSALAHVALDNVAKHIETNTDPDFNLRVLETSLSKLGFGAAKGGVIVNNTQQNVYLGTKEDLEMARQLINKKQTQALPAVEILEALPYGAQTEG
jgi:hypothetical protein